MLFKKVLLGAILPTLVGVSIIGAGYSTWLFGKSTTATGTGSVTSADSGLSVDHSTFGIVCDQPKDDNSNPNGKGLYFTYDNNGTTTDLTSLAFTYTGTTAGNVSFSATLADKSGSSSISTYLTVATYNDSNNTESTFKDWSVSSSSQTYNLTLADVLSYGSGKVPTDYSNWKTLNGLSGFTLTITASFTVTTSA